MTAPVYVDVRCGDDVDAFGRDAGPVEALAQDLFHFLETDKGSLLDRGEGGDADWGFGLQSYLGQPIPTTLAADIEASVLRYFDGVVSAARCVIKPLGDVVDGWDLKLTCEVEGQWLELAFRASPDGGIVRVS